jgi:hypothetical protein
MFYTETITVFFLRSIEDTKIRYVGRLQNLNIKLNGT